MRSVLQALIYLTGTVSLPSFNCRRVDQHTLEVQVDKGQNINQVFAELSQLGINIVSMRSRANRLEEMFVNLVEGAA